MIASSTVTCTMLAGIAILYYMQSTKEIPNFQMLLFCMFSIFSCVFMGIVFPLVTLLQGELLPQSVKRAGTGLNMFTFSIVLFVNSRTFLPIAETFGMGANFIQFAIFNLIMIAYVYFDVPETRGRTLVEIQNELKSVGISRTN